MIYLDNAATTLYKPEPVRRAVYEAMGTVGNSGRGAWGPALSASRLVYSVREKAAEFFGAWGGESVAFTSNATEALNIAIEGLVKKGDHVITTQAEHNSVLRPLYRKEKEGAELTILPADEKGNFSLADMEKAVRQNTTAVICTHASNVTGNLFPAEAIGNLCRRHGLLFILDASQSAGEAFIDMQSMHIDVLCFTGHKGLMGPQGTGGICVDPQVKIPPFKTGGSGILSFDREHPDCMPEALEAGTLNIHGLAGLGAAFDYLRETGLEKIIEHEKRLAKLFYEEVKDIEGLKVYGDFSTGERTPAVSLNVAGYASKEAGEILAGRYQIATRAGVHCAPLIHEALGTRERGTLRFSFSWFNTEEEIYKAALAVREIGQEWKYEE
ncbi:MAG TPA: aminotransferase class V-fold PLP-dependent enzyme [Candidatus Blautia merdigallinarum]|uniref:cysteine desulfurase n=1 Tax=Candidatus Blautia merdigallinarum TaxID=2838495 RepID=A0A9D2N5J7_9FIRM|nr:aminotransferase class V-fold PLP-dependent enzyme [Candidatus Blautia merdigallinarum]